MAVSVIVAVLAWTGPALAAAPLWGGRYSVRAGDSLTAIALHFGVSLQTLAAANGLDWREPLLVGRVLRVPAAGSAASSWRGVYVVRFGDTLSGIAVHFDVSLVQLASANGIDAGAVLLSGSRLRIPTGAKARLDLAQIVESDPYRHAAIGSDVSYPNCGGAVPTPQAFTIVGLNAGRPFTTNPCLATEWAAAPQPGSVYINTAYSPRLFRHITPDCATTASSQPLSPAAQRAYAVGCSEAVAALALLAGRTPLAIWLDIEPGNSWSPQQSLNTATIQGMLEQLLSQSPHPPVGVYSNANFWSRIAGDWTSLSLPEWVATGAPDPPGCPSSFAGGPVWVSQSSNGGYDTDTAC